MMNSKILKIFTIQIAAYFVLVEGQYLGCYKESWPLRHFNRNPGALGNKPLTPQICYQICGGEKFEFAALGMGRFCSCSSTSPDGILAKDTSDTKCTLPCPGDSGEQCGSAAYVSVYKAPPSLTHTIDVAPKIVASGNAITLTPQAEPSGLGFDLRIDFNYQAGKTEYSENGTDFLSHKYAMASEYEILSYVTDVGNLLPDSASAVAVLVDSAPFGVSVQCPENMATYDIYHCIIQVTRGTNIQATISYTDGNPGLPKTDTFMIADAMEYSMGNFVRQHILTTPSVSATSTSGLIIHHGYPAQSSGVLVAVEYYGVGTGTINVHVYRPDCGAQMYCFESNTCENSCDVPCGGNYCMDIDNCCGSPITRSTALLPTYTIVETIPVSITLGYGYVDLTSTNKIQIGDVLAHDGQASPLIANNVPGEPPGTVYDYYCSGQVAPATINMVSCVQVPEVHQLRAVIAETSEIDYQLEFTMPGNVSFQVTVTNQVGSDVGSDNIMVLTGVNATVIDVPEYFAANMATDVKVEPYTGNPADVSWDFGNGQQSGSDLATTTHTYTAIGQYNISVNISNAVSFKFNYTTITVEETISGLAINSPGNIIEVDAVTSIDIGMSTGSDYVCDLEFSYNDGSIVSIQRTELQGLTFDHTFTVAGSVTVTVNCSNNIGSVQTSKISQAVEPLTSVALSPPGANAGEEFYFLLTWVKGTDVTLLTFKYDGVDIPMIVDSNLRQAKSVEPRTEAVTGSHTVEYQLQNPLGSVSVPSTDFIIEIAMANVVIDCIFPSETPGVSTQYIVIPLNTDVSITIDMDAGTSVAIDINYGDGNVFSQAAVAGVPWATAKPTFGFPIVHTFTLADYYEIEVKVSNSFSTVVNTYSIAVMVGVDNAVMNPVVPVRFGPPAILNFTFAVPPPIPNDVTLYIEWGDGNYDTYYPCNLLDTFPHEYLDADGTLELKYRLENLVSSKEGTIPVYIVTPIIDNVCSVSKEAGVPGVPIDLVFTSWRAPPPGELNLTFDCDTTVPGFKIKRLRENPSPDGEDTESCTYSTTGTYTMSVRAESQMEDITCNHQFKILNPVTDDFDVIIPDAPMDKEFITDCRFDYSIIYNGSPVPDEATIEVDYGDNSPVFSQPFTQTLNSFHSYAQAGHYISKIRIYNAASESVKNFLTGCYEDFSAIGITVRRIPGLPLGSPPALGFGASNNIYSGNEEIVIFPTFTKGTLVWWDVTAVSTDNIYSCNKTEKDNITLSIPEPGDYTITIVARSPVHTGLPVTYTAKIMRPVDNITISSFVQTRAFQDKNFTISMLSYASTMCVAVNFGVDNEDIELFGDAVTCSDTTQASLHFPGASFKNGVLTDVSDAFTVTHYFTAEGTYTMEVFAWNYISSSSADYQFVISSLDCSAPNIDIRERSRDFRSPMQFLRSKRAKITGLTDIVTCPNTVRNKKQWTAFQIEPTTGEVIKEIDISGVNSSVNSELAFDPLYLQVGVYLLYYKVTMLTPNESEEEFSSKAETYIKIKPSPLIAQVFNGSISMLTIGPNSLLTLHPSLFSTDPDVDESNGELNIFDSVMMACRDMTQNESFPNMSVEVIPMNFSDLAPLHNDEGGCFQTGPGWFKHFTGFVAFWSDILTPGHTYEFKLIIQKGDRENTSMAQVQVATADPPHFDMSFMIPQILKSSADGKRFNPNMQLGMFANLVQPCPMCTYQWEMFAYDYQFCGETYNCWRNLAYLGRYIEGDKSDQLTVRTEVFSHYHEVDLFQLRLYVTDNSTGITGLQIMNLTRNHPPANGNCTFSPSTGIAMQTNFSIHCDDFIDEDPNDEIVSYVIRCKTSDGERIVLEDSFPHWENRYLPVGDIDDGSILRCNVTVTDDLGASGTYPLPEVTVARMSFVEFKDMIKDLQDADNDIAEVIAAVGNLDQATTFVSALVSMLQEMSEDDETGVVNGCGSILSYASSGLFSNTSRPTAFTQTVFNETVMGDFEITRNAAANLVEKMTEALTTSTAESPAETNQLTSAISTMSKSISSMTRGSQAALTDLLDKGLTNVLKHEDSMSIEQMKSITQNTMDACANIGESAALVADHPTITDEDTQEETVKTFDTSLHSSLPDVKSHTSDAAALKDGKRILNKEVQTKFSAGNFEKCTNIQETLLERLSLKLPNSPNPMIMETSSSATALYKNEAKSLANKTIDMAGCSVIIPPDIIPSTFMDSTLTFSLVVNAAPSVVREETSPAKKTSRTVKMGYKDSSGKPIKIRNLDPPLTVKIPQDPNAPKTNMSELRLENPEIVPTRHEEIFFYHKTEIINPRAALKLTFRPTNITASVQLLVVTNFDEKPALDATQSKIKHVCTIPSDTSLTGQYGSSSEPDPYSCFIPSSIISDNTGSYYIGVRQLAVNELDTIKAINDLPVSAPEIWKTDKTFTTDYRFNSVELTCVYNEDGQAELKADGVEPSELSTQDKIICLTSHLTTFAGGWAVAPNSLDWNFIFSNADFFKNPTLYITEIVIALAYIVAMIWARRKDRQDLEKLGLAPLLDNDPRDKYYYEIMVSTGMRRGAGTESKVHFILSGEEEETDVRTFEDKKRKIFTRGSTDGFLMSVPEPIGALNYLRIWHDNSGKGRQASWYLNHVIVRDVQTDKKYYFIANRWFAVEEDDGQVDRVIPVAGKEQMTEFSHLFAERATKNLSDGHLWFSVVARPPQSRFTRCQRVSCCLCLLYTSMLANAMFYGTETSDANAFQFGPFALSSEQIFIGVVCNIIIFPVNFLLITLFRKSRPRKLRPSRVEEAIRSKPERTTSMADVNPRVKSSLDYERPGSSFLMDTKRSQSSMSRPETSMSGSNLQTDKKKKKKCELPWWFVIVSWILLWIAVLVSAAFVTFYGIMFQDIKCKKWITSMLISFFTSVFFTQPIKVFLFAIIFSLIIKNPGGDEEEDDDEEAPKKLDTDEEFLHEEEDEFGFISPRKPLYKPKPPDTKALEAARKQRLKEIQMWSVIREILFYAFFLWILLVISYRNVSTDSYNYKHNMQKVFILTNDTNKAFSKVRNTEDFWTWAKSGMLRGLRAGPYYNFFPPFYMRGYINDKQSRLMGYAILRQTRITPGSCKLPKYVEGIVDECNGAYDIASEEDGDFDVGWTKPVPVNSTRYEYTYNTGSSLDSYPYWGEMALYGGGGYIVKLDKSYEDMIVHLNQLQTEGWIDKYTRSVFLEFTVYNPSINLFSVSTLLAEFLPNGGVFTSFRFEPCNLLPYMNSALLFQIICEIVYFLFSVFFVFKEIKNIIKQKKEYFFQFWNLVDLGICAMSVTAIVIYFYRLFCINRLTEYFNETKGNEYMKFQYVGYWSEIFNYIIGFLVFFATLKFLKLLRFNKKISMLSDTLRNSSKDLIHFSIIFNVVFLAFIQVFYLVFMAHLDTFKTFHRSMEAGIVMMMGKFDIYNMLGVNQWLTQIFIFLFVVTVTFIVVNMLLSILNDTFSAVRNDKAKQQNDYEIVDFMLGRFKTWTGIGRDNTTISPSEMEERNKNYRTIEGQIEYFPDQIDRFLASVSNMYMGDERFEAFLQKGMAKKMAMKAQAQQEGMSHPPPRVPGALRISNGARGMTDVQTD